MERETKTPLIKGKSNIIMGWEGKSFLPEGKEDEITRVNNEKGDVTCVARRMGKVKDRRMARD